MKYLEKQLFFLTLLVIMMSSPSKIFSQPQTPPTIEWTLAAVLQNQDKTPSLGLAGPINGLHNNVLLVAGGANFPEKMPWEGGKKRYADAIHVLENRGEDFVWNTKQKSKLPEPIAYCGVTSTPVGVVYVGGENEQGLSNKSYLLIWEAVRHEVAVLPLPNFPKPIANIALTAVGNVVYAIGGDEAKCSSQLFYSLDLNALSPQWKALPDLPIALANAAVVVQETKEGTAIFVIGGRTKTAAGISDLHSTTFVFSLEKQTWTTAAQISDGKNITNFSAGAAVAINEQYLLLLGGDNGLVFHKIETFLAQIAQTNSTDEKAKLIAEKNLLNTTHQGFYKAMLLYNTWENTWKKVGELPFLSPVTTTALYWGKNIILSNGEIKPGVRTPNIMLGKIKN